MGILTTAVAALLAVAVATGGAVRAAVLNQANSTTSCRHCRCSTPQFPAKKERPAADGVSRLSFGVQTDDVATFTLARWRVLYI